ncbi:MAG: SpoIIE family protein phosphatase [Pseudanabaenaceae cyanobacterium]
MNNSRFISDFSRYPAAVLLVDDQPMVAEAVRRMLVGESNISFFYCDDPAQAIKTAIDVSPTVILQDLVMPDIDGIMLVKFFRSHPSTRNIPMIVLSTKEDPKLKAEAFAVGANDYLIKLPDKAELIARIRYHSRAYLNLCLAEERATQLALANEQISKLNARLKRENLRLSTELDVARKIQAMILPKSDELKELKKLDIDGFMEPASEVGGDYYDVWQNNGVLHLSIGDVTGHGLESGLLMLMVQTAVRAISAVDVSDPIAFLQALNKVIYDNTRRINSDRNLSFILLSYKNNQLTITGQHESVILLKHTGEIELIDSIDLGFPLGLEADIQPFIHTVSAPFESGDTIVLYTDGIVEAENSKKEHYGLERLCMQLKENAYKPAQEIRKAIIKDLKAHIGKQRIYDDITLLVIKHP